MRFDQFKKTSEDFQLCGTHSVTMYTTQGEMVPDFSQMEANKADVRQVIKKGYHLEIILVKSDRKITFPVCEKFVHEYIDKEKYSVFRQIGEAVPRIVKYLDVYKAKRKTNDHNLALLRHQLHTEFRGMKEIEKRIFFDALFSYKRLVRFLNEQPMPQRAGLIERYSDYLLQSDLEKLKKRNMRKTRINN